MQLIKSLFIAFSIYSKIPVPQFAWKEEDMKFTLCFFPWVGAAIGGCLILWRILCKTFGVGEIAYAAVGTAVPLLLTGGFHVDGFMDTMDAFHSYQPREKKLEILKDPHIGAFAVIMVCAYGLLYIGAFSQIQDEKLFRIFCAGFFLARCLSGISVISFPRVTDGMLSFFAGSAHKRAVRWSLYLQGAACVGFMLFQSPLPGGIVAASALLAFAYYFYRTKKEFGGISGDMAGYFILLCEGCMAVTAAVTGFFMG